MSLWPRPCACGTTIWADPIDAFPDVQRHVETPIHRRWSDATSWFPRPTHPDPTAVTSPVDVSSAGPVRPVRRRRPRGRLVPS